MEKLIPIMNRIQDALGSVEYRADISFPRIVVVGSQSAGKSSVLESLVGKDFLPRGSNMVTRRPLILQLEFKPNIVDYGVFEHKPNAIFKDFSEIRKEIEIETEKLLGKNGCISDNPIRLKIFSSSVVDITLVDLPGLTKIAVRDQPHDISDQIKNMVLTYISDENTLILAVSAANQDLATSESLSLAKKIDTKGTRTLGILTKIDLLDRGTDDIR